MSEDNPTIFEAAFRRFWRGLENVRPVNEEIERVYRQRVKHKPTACPHGLTTLTCADCYLNGWKGER